MINQRSSRKRKLPNGKILDRNMSFNDFVDLIPDILNSNIRVIITKMALTTSI